MFWAGVGENGGLDGSTVGYGLIGIDGSIGLFSVEEILDELDDLGNSGTTTDQDDFVDGALSHTAVL